MKLHWVANWINLVYQLLFSFLLVRFGCYAILFKLGIGFYVFCDLKNQALHLKRKNILFVGAPGSGKGTYSRIISPVLMV